MAFAAPVLWALVVLLDVYFVHRVYGKAQEATVISGLFQGIVFLLIPFVGFTWPGNMAGLLFMAGGIAFALHVLWYFKSMFIVRDGALVYILANFSTIFVPILAWIFIGESMNFSGYAGIILVFAGGVAITWAGGIQKKNLTIIAKPMIPTVVFFSVGMILQKRGYEITTTGFWPGFFLFSLGIVLGGILVFLFNNERKNLLGQIKSLSGKHGLVFIFAESLSVAGIWTSQKAISLAPSVSLVAAIESLVPLFVMAGSLPIMFFYRDYAMDIYKKQIAGLGGKLVAIILIATGIYLAVRG